MTFLVTKKDTLFHGGICEKYALTESSLRAIFAEYLQVQSLKYVF